MNAVDLAYAGLARQAQLVAAGTVSARELVELSLERIERFDPQLNAFGAVYAEQALAQADRPRPGPLSGVPIAVKDEMDIAGEITSRGTGAITERAAQDAEVVRRLKDAGAIVIGKTTMPELGLWPFTESITWGVTRNPWDTDRTPGGSSGGSAAAVAAGLVPAATAGDGAGSIRIPAACCGLFGLKPHAHRVPREHDDTHWICFGGLTRSVRDARLMYDVMAPGIEAPPRRRLRIAYSERFPPATRGSLTHATAAALRDTRDLLQDLGHEVIERDPDFRARDVPVILGLMFRGIRDFVGEVEQPQRLERRTRHIARPGQLVSDRTVDRLLEAEQRIASRVGKLWEDVDVLLMPILAAPAVPAQIMEGRGATVTYLWESGWVPFGVLWNSTGQPAVSVPAGFGPDGLPLAVQFVGRPHGEGTLLTLSEEIEDARPWGLHRPAAFAW
ncbi:amidase family protein [Solirubrobacter soli]|uniref:amidase family protein n=1 Tax=Solirubrobacter soli TaxID=363832 RepID=UPI00040A34E6|nr:amidase family protein [Solirubrobacter soli]